MSDTDKKRVLILDGETRSALAVIRSLGKNHYTCFVCSPQKNAISFASRYTQANLISPAFTINDSQSHNWLLHTITHLGIDYIIPTTEKSLLCIYSNEALVKFLHRLPFPSFEAFSKSTDKLEIAELINSDHLRYPKTCPITSTTFNALEKILPFPFIIKPRRSITHSKESQQTIKSKTPVAYIKNSEDLKKICASTYFKTTEEFIAQEHVQGSGVGVFLLIKEGKVVTSFSHKRILEKPPEGGVSVLSQSIFLNEAELEACAALLNSLNWEGVAMIECKQVQGKLIVMEINPRFWGSLQLAIDAESNFPLDLIESANHKHHWNAFIENTSLRWELGSLDHAFIKLKRSPLRACFDITMKNALKISPKHRLEIFRRDDKGPFIQEIKNYFR